MVARRAIFGTLFFPIIDVRVDRIHESLAPGTVPFCERWKEGWFRPTVRADPSCSIVPCHIRSCSNSDGSCFGDLIPRIGSTILRFIGIIPHVIIEFLVSVVTINNNGEDEQVTDSQENPDHQNSENEDCPGSQATIIVPRTMNDKCRGNLLAPEAIFILDLKGDRVLPGREVPVAV